jgi:hypothetical protein
LTFLNGEVLPSLKKIDQDSRPTEDTYRLIEGLRLRAVASNATRGRPTSMLSKLALAICPLVFIPYDSKVQETLRRAGKRIQGHHYVDYMSAVLSEKAGLDHILRERGLSAHSLNAVGMSHVLFELRVLDKWLMLRGGFDRNTMMRELGGH